MAFGADPATVTAGLVLVGAFTYLLPIPLGVLTSVTGVSGSGRAGNRSWLPAFFTHRLVKFSLLRVEGANDGVKQLQDCHYSAHA